MGRAGLQAFVAKVTSRLRPRDKASTSTSDSTSHGGQHNQTLRLLSVIFLVFLLFLSAAALILKANTFSFIEMNREMGFYLEIPEEMLDTPEQPLVAALPLGLFRVSEKIILVTASLNILLSMGHLVLIGINWKSRTRVFTIPRNAMVLHVLNSCLLLIAMVSIFLTNKMSSRFRFEDIPTSHNAVSPTGFRYFSYDVGTFDLESWTCALKDQPAVGMAREDYAKQCAIEIAGKVVMVPFFFMALAVAGISVWRFMSMGKIVTGDEQLWTKDLELEMGKLHDDKGVKVEEIELDTADTVGRPKDGRLSKIEEDESEEPEESPTAKDGLDNKDLEEDKNKPASKS